MKEGWALQRVRAQPFLVASAFSYPISLVNNEALVAIEPLEAQHGELPHSLY